ncbi:transporter substrate-binding domain-containing protein [Sulfurovum riftiae]|uniref:Solute-binding protein family 3/N-terminal domain-containing protein n=1 Tax=Sulfurovum riftiae TaxID=1630136 RepID=A0A151CH46_9BACT|nr:transporter substrate-binding domain-containing protein [Sulfurovum riftiae]KYJ86754.1 hypothetical protein AS592_07965 [Sulfurovum riftiae]
MRVIWFLLIWFILLPLQASAAPVTQAQLSEKEKAWIAEHPVINFTGDPDWLPYEAFSKDGRYLGIIPEVLRIIEQQTALKFNVIPTKTWDESVSLLESGKADMMTVSDAWNDPKYLYTRPMLSSPIVIVMDRDHSYIESVYYLQYDDIAIVKGYRYVEQIKKKYPDYNFHEVKNIQEGLEGVATGKYDAMLASMALATYTIETLQLNNIQVIGKTEFSIKILFAIKKEMAPLVDIINKVTIDEKQAHELLKEWTYQKYVEKTDYGLIAELAILLLVILFAALILYFVFKKKSQKYQQIKNLLTRTNSEVDDAIRYASLLDTPDLLPSDEISTFFDDSFLVSQHGKIKSSTLIHFTELDPDKGLLILVDAKGEHINGVLNSLFCKRVLKRVIDQVKARKLDADPAAILGSLEKELQHQLGEADAQSRPNTIGFDAAVAILDKAASTLLYAGANIPLFYTQDHEVKIASADTHSIGSGNTRYTNHIIEISDTTDFYLLTNAYIEQIGGKEVLPAGKRRIKEILKKYELQTMGTQRDTFVKTLQPSKGKQPEMGDITIIGFRVTL